MRRRAGFAWSPPGLEQTKISGGYGLIYNATNLNLFTRPADQYSINTYYPEAGSEYSSIVNYVASGHRLASPRYQNFNLGWEQRFAGGLFAGVQAIERRGQHGLSYFDAGGLTPAITYQLRDAGRDNYTGLELTLRHNLRRHYQWLASYTRSVARSNSVLDLNTDQPLIVSNNAGRLPWDAPNRFVSWGFLPTPLKSWSLAYLAEWHSGFPFSIQNENGVVLGGVNAFRYPIYFDVDAAVERQFDLRGQRWAWRMGLNNLTGHRNFDTVNNMTDSPQFMRFYGGQGRGVGFRVRWLGKL